MNKKALEWLRQADYDIDTAEFMYGGGRYFYTIFMCHLAIEKAFKGLYSQRLAEVPPKTHNLIYLLNKIGLKPDEHIGKIITKLNEASVATRYPDDLKRMQDDYNQTVSNQILTQTKEILEWIKKQF